MFFVMFLVKNAKNDPRTLFEPCKSDKSGKFKHTEITGQSVKNSRFRPSEHQNSVTFRNAYLTSNIHIHQTEFLHICYGFVKIRKFSPFPFK